MEALGINWFDIIAVGVVLFSGVMAFARGLIREVFSIVAFIGAAIAAVYLAPNLRDLVEQFTALEGVLATLAAGFIIFLVVFVVITILTSVLAKTAHQSAEIGTLDRIGGAAFGLVRGVIVVALFVLLMLKTTDDEQAAPQAPMPPQITEGATYDFFRVIAETIDGVLPGLRDRVDEGLEKMKNRRDVGTPQSVTTPVPPPQQAPDAGGPAEEPAEE